VRFLRAVGRFWYDFVIGDDPKIAVAVVSALALSAVLVVAGLPAAVLAPLAGCLVAAAFLVALAADTRR